MYITWKYDIFPHEICGKVIEAKGLNTYTVEGFGGMQFEAKRRIKDDALGETIKNILEKYAEDYRKEIAEVNERNRDQVAFILTYLTGLK